MHFYINIPVGIVGLILGAKFIPADEKRQSVKLDIPGSLLIFAALFQTPNNTAVMSTVSAGIRVVASSVLATSRNLGMVMGVALSGALFSLAAGTGIPAGAVSPQMQGTFIHAMNITYLVAGFVAILAVLASLTRGNTRPAPGTGDGPQPIAE